MELKVENMLIQQAIEAKRMGITEGDNQLEVCCSGCYTAVVELEAELNETTEIGCVDEFGNSEQLRVTNPYIEVTAVNVFDIEGDPVMNVNFEENFLKKLKDKLYYYL